MSIAATATMPGVVFYTPQSIPFVGCILPLAPVTDLAPNKTILMNCSRQWLAFKVQMEKIIWTFASTSDWNGDLIEVSKFRNKRGEIRGYWFEDTEFPRSSHSLGSSAQSELKITVSTPSNQGACEHTRCTKFLHSWLSCLRNYANQSVGGTYR